MQIMILTRLGFLSKNGFSLSQRFTSRAIKRNASSKAETKSYEKPLKLQEDNDLDKPVEYSKTEAATWLARHSRFPEENKPPYQSYVISASLTVFMVYFFILREENDIDLLIDQPLSNVIEGIDKSVNKSSKRSQ